MNKKVIFCLLILICIVSISHVSATDNPDNVTSDEDYADVVLANSQDDILDDDNQIGTFRDLDDLIRRNMQVVELDKDYIYCPEVDNKAGLESGIWMGTDLYLDGRGHTIYGNGTILLRVLSPTKNINVEIYNLRFENIYSPDYIKTSSCNLEKGGVIFNQGNLYLRNCTFINNYAKYGGVIYNDFRSNSNLYVTNCTFVNCSSSDNGGAIYSLNKVKVDDSNFYNCSSSLGGAIYNLGEAYISNSCFKDNIASIEGGAVHNTNYCICEVYNSTFHRNIARNGGALKDCIAAYCYFEGNNFANESGSDMYNGVSINCTCENDNGYFNTTLSNGFSFRLDKLFYVYNNETLNIAVTNNLDGGKIGGVALRLAFEDEQHHTHEYVVSSLKNGVAELYLKSLENGIYKLRISFVNRVYNDTELTYNVLIGKRNSVVHFITTVVFVYGSIGSVHVNVTGGTVQRENIHVVNHSEASIDFEDNIISISGLDVGNYTLSVITTPDETHFATQGLVNFTIKKAVATISASKLTVALKKGTLWSISLVDPVNNKPIKNMELVLKIYTGTKYRTVTVKTNSKGIATYKTSSLTQGTHNIVVTGKHSGYTFNTLKSSIKVIKPKQLTFKLQKRVNDKKGALISYIVKDKKTGKGVNGIKIKLLIYTGKKVKTVTLKSKKSGKYNGAFGFATNALSVGKHVVKIEPASISYSGFTKTTMIIKKESKNRPLYSHKL